MDERKKPGVMLYFDPMKYTAQKCSDTQLAQLIRALLRYADPDIQEEPTFTDPELDKLWDHIRVAIDRDSERYGRKKSGNRYAQFCRWFKHYRGTKTTLTYDLWESIGCPDYHQYAGSEYDTDNGQKETEPEEDEEADTKPTSYVREDTPYIRVDTPYVQEDTGPDTQPGLSPHNQSETNLSSYAGTETERESNTNRRIPQARTPAVPTHPFRPPTEREVVSFFLEEELDADPYKFFNYYESTGWKGIADWKARARYWEDQDAEKERRGLFGRKE